MSPGAAGAVRDPFGPYAPMYANTNKGMERNKLLAVVLAIAMIACCITFVATAVDAEGNDTTAATELPDADDGVITLTEDVTLEAATTITNPVVIGDYTLTIKADVDVDFSYTEGLQHIFTIGAGSIVIDGGSLTITADNDTDYTPISGQGNHVFYRASADYSTDAGTIILKSGSLSVTEDAAVDGQLSAGPITYMIQGGSASFNGNGIGPAYFIQDAGSVSFDSNNGRLQVYYDLNGGSLAVDGNNSENPIFTPYAMDIAKGATLNVNGKMDVYSGQSTEVASGIQNVAIKSVANNGTMVIGANGSLDVPTGSTFTNNGQTNVYGSISGEGTLTNNGKVAILSQTATVVDMGGSGVVDTSAISENATLSGRLLTSTTFTDRQIVTVTDDLTLVSGTTLTIQGQLVIPEGVRIIIEQGAALIIKGQSVTVENNGTILVQSSGSTIAKTGLVIEGGVFNNNGTVEAQFLPTSTEVTEDTEVISISAVFENNGAVNIGTDSAIDISGTFNNNANATMTVNGTIGVSGTFDNAGIFTISGNTDGTIAISLSSADAVANINAVIGNIVVNNANFVSSTSEEFANTSNDSITINGKDTNSVGGLVVKATTYTADDKVYKALDVSGTLTVMTGDGATAAYSDSILRLSGDNIRITDTLTIGAGVELCLGPYNSSIGTTKITVLGTMNITAQSGETFKITPSGSSVDFIVSGEISSLAPLHNITGVQMNAAMYTTVESAITTYTYTTLAAAVDAVAGVTTPVVNVYGTISVDGEITITDGMTVTMNNTSKIDITADGRIEVSENGKIVTNGNIIDVDGSLYVANARSGLTGVNTTEGSETILSQVYSSNGTDALYTNIVDAMEAAESGDVITLYSKPVELQNTSFTIKEGVTVDTNGKEFVVSGSNLTINGTLFINDSEYTVQSYEVSENYSAPSTVTLNGYIKNTAQMTYSESDLRYPAGAYYTMTENGVPYYYISTVANAAAVINDVENNTVLIDGKLALGTVEFTGTEDEQAIVNISATAEVTSGNVTLNMADLNVISGAQFTASVTDGVGTVDVVIVDSDEAAAIAAPTFTVTSEDGLTATGTATGAEMTFEGEVIIKNLSVAVMNVDGTVTVDGNNSVVTKALNVAGTLNVATGVLTGTAATSYITGTMTTAVASAESSVIGSAVLGPMYVGIGVEDGKLVDGTAGTVSGNVTATIAYVSSDSNVPEDMISADGMKSTQFFVGEDIWMTAYTATGVAANVPNAPVVDAQFIGWKDADGNLVYSDTNDKCDDTDAIVVGAYDGKLYADIKYDVYTVFVVTDNSIGSVAIDGQLLVNTANGFALPGDAKLTAGQHKITYTLSAGYEGDATLSSTVASVSGMDFTLSGDFSNPIYLTLGGAVYSGSTVVIDGGNGDDGLGLTDILLIILVVLIVIMAIIVALRMMRS